MRSGELRNLENHQKKRLRNITYNIEERLLNRFNSSDKSSPLLSRRSFNEGGFYPIQFLTYRMLSHLNGVV